MRKIYDLHVHTHYSIDGEKSADNSILNLSKKAKQQGFSGIAFTDHFDADLISAKYESHDSKNIRLDIEKAQYELNDNNFTVINGIEIGSQRYFGELCSEEIKNYGYDLVISSIHIPGANINYLLSMAKLDQWSDTEIISVFNLYMDDLLYTAKHCDFDILAHITYPMRYFRRFKKDHLTPIENYYDIYDEIFKQLIHRGKALEVNTSGLRQGNGETFPAPLLIKRYLELGGEMFTVGSDSHSFSDCTADVRTVTDMLSGLGARYSCYFKERKPIMIKL